MIAYTRADLVRVANAAAAKAAGVQRAACRELIARAAAAATGGAKRALVRTMAAVDALPVIAGVELSPERDRPPAGLVVIDDRPKRP